MNKQQISNLTIIKHKIMGFLANVFGYALVFIFGLTLLFGKLKDAPSIISVIIFIILGTLLIVCGIKTKKRIQRFNKYISIISLENQTSLENIASSCSQSIDFVTNDLQAMINKKFFTNAYINKNTNEFIMKNKNIIVENNNSKKAKKLEIRVITCKNCGASNNITSTSTVECEFCGSAL